MSGTTCRRDRLRVKAVLLSATVVATAAAHGAGFDPCLNYSSHISVWPDTQYRPENPSTYELPAYLNSTSFVVLSKPRSATNALTQVLNANSYVQMGYEEFHPGIAHPPFSDYGWTLARREANRTAFMEALFELNERPAKPGALARGFKVFENHVSKDELMHLTRSKHLLKIVLRRQDTFSQYVSALRGNELGVWGPPRGKGQDTVDAFANLRVPICMTAFREYAAGVDAWYDWLADESRTHPESWLFLSTEKLVADPSILASIYTHLKVPIGKALRYRPYTPDVIEDKISNYDDIKDEITRAFDNTW